VSDYAASETVRWIPLAPLLAGLGFALMLTVFRRPLSRPLVVGASCGAATLAFVLSCVAFWELVSSGARSAGIVDRVYTWVGAGIGESSFTADLAFVLDPLSAVLCLVVTAITALGGVYAAVSLRDEPRDDGGLPRFFCLLNAFLFSMLVLLLADNLLLFFVGWEGAALASYLLIGFWHTETTHAAAAQRAFLIDRVGDFGLLVGTLLLFWGLASLGEGGTNFRDLALHVNRLEDASIALPAWLGGGSWPLLVVAGACFLLAACARSAQGPLIVWLPEAMAAPTPASALVHGALGVGAGVYLLCRLSFLYASAPELSAWIAWTGGVTALAAALVACVQTDVKQLLAFVTASQLGAMFVAAGSGAWTAAVFLLTTHAFFAALLFLGAGAIVQAMDQEADLRKMGGLRSKLIRVHLVMGIGTAAAAGLPFFAGFFSRNEVALALRQAEGLPGASLLYALWAVTCALLAFALSRMMFMAFYGHGRLPARIRSDMEDPGNGIMVPLYVLATLSIFGGLLGLPQAWGDILGVDDSNSLGNFVARVVAAAPPAEAVPGAQWGAVALLLGCSLIGFLLALQVYVLRPELPARLQQRFGGAREVVAANFYLGRAQEGAAQPLKSASGGLRVFDERFLEAWTLRAPARALRRFVAQVLKHAQSGQPQAYLFTSVVSCFALVGYLLFRVLGD
jgi:NADH-quinone oxidoreductase subunit L